VRHDPLARITPKNHSLRAFNSSRISASSVSVGVGGGGQQCCEDDCNAFHGELLKNGLE
jgi:hypothetical protein